MLSTRGIEYGVEGQQMHWIPKLVRKLSHLLYSLLAHRAVSLKSTSNTWTVPGAPLLTSHEYVIYSGELHFCIFSSCDL